MTSQSHVTDAVSLVEEAGNHDEDTAPFYKCLKVTILSDKKVVIL